MRTSRRSAGPGDGGSQRGTPIQTRERRIALIGLAAVTALAWLYLLQESASMGSAMESMPAGTEAMPAGTGSAPSSGPMGDMRAWSTARLATTFVMWGVMMVGMMLPSATPAILFYQTVVRKNAERGLTLASTWTFIAGYLAVWLGFGLVATLLQAGLTEAALLTPSLSSASRGLSSAILIVAGIYPWLPIKDACLASCRSPLELFVTAWRPGESGAFRTGFRHGAYCLGCCWALMLLLFVAGVMNLLWVALIAAFVFAEKALPRPMLTARTAGVLLIATGTGTGLGFCELC